MRRIRPLFACLALAGCAIMFRGTSEFTATYELEGVDTLQLHLPVDMEVIGDPAREDMTVEGVWTAVGGTEDAAIENAEAATMPFEIFEGVGRLTMEVPIEVQGLVDLALGAVRAPAHLDLEIDSAGDVDVGGFTGWVEVETAEGDVSVLGGAGGVIVSATGDVDVAGAGQMDVQTGGDVVIDAFGQARDVIVDTSGGDIEVILASDADIDLQITGDEIRVETPQISTVSSGSYERRLGNGSVAVWLDASGDVSVRTGP